MKRLIFNTLLPLLLLAVTLPANATETFKITKKEFVKKIEKSFNINATGTFELINKYGKVDIKTWDKNTIDIEVSIVVNARSESAAEDAFDRINVEFDNSSNYVLAETTIESNKSSWWASNEKSDFEINYLVRMPKTNDLKLSNKYGHSFVENIGGDVEAQIKYGNLNMAEIDGDLNLTLGYGNGSIESAANTKIDLKYGNLHLKRSKDMDIDSKYSNLIFTEVGDVSSNSKYDTYEIESVAKFRGDGKYDNYEFGSAEKVDIYSKYTNVKIGDLEDAIKVENSYGTVYIKNLSDGFSEVDLEGSHSEFKIGVASNAKFTIDLSVDYGDIRYPNGVEVMHDKRQSHSHTVKGFKGSESAKGSIKVQTSYGSVKIHD